MLLVSQDEKTFEHQNHRQTCFVYLIMIYVRALEFLLIDFGKVNEFFFFLKNK